MQNKNTNAYGDQELWSIKSEYQDMVSTSKHNAKFPPTHESRLLPW